MRVYFIFITSTTIILRHTVSSIQKKKIIYIHTHLKRKKKKLNEKIKKKNIKRVTIRSKSPGNFIRKFNMLYTYSQIESFVTKKNFFPTPMMRKKNINFHSQAFKIYIFQY